MTNKKRFLMMVIAAMMLISAFSVCVFATNPINYYFYNIVPGYRVNYFARYITSDNRATAHTQIVWDDDDKASIITAQAASQCVIAYTDNSFSVGNHTSELRLLTGKGQGVLSMAPVDADVSKIIDYIETEHHLTISGADPITKVYYLYAGVDF